jgi:hypothetical protein
MSAQSSPISRHNTERLIDLKIPLVDWTQMAKTGGLYITIPVSTCFLQDQGMGVFLYSAKCLKRGPENSEVRDRLRPPKLQNMGNT